MTALYDLFGLNRWLFALFNKPQGSFAEYLITIADRIGDFTAAPYYFLFFIFCTALAAFMRRIFLASCLHFTGTWLLATALAFASAHALKLYFLMPRPFAALAAGNFHVLAALDKTVRADLSFPSGHATFSACLAASLWPFLNLYGKGAAVAFVMWVAWSRVAAGVHFPVDVAAGAGLGVLCALAARKIFACFSKDAQKQL